MVVALTLFHSMLRTLQHDVSRQILRICESSCDGHHAHFICMHYKLKTRSDFFL